MAVRLETTIKRFIGDSEDQKPVVGSLVEGVIIAAQDVPIGSSFLETDTGRIYRYSSDGWVVFVPENEEAYLLSALLVEVAGINQLLTLAIGQEIAESVV